MYSKIIPKTSVAISCRLMILILAMPLTGATSLPGSALSPVSTAHPSKCQEFFQSNGLKAFMAHYTKLSSLKPLWDKYRPENQAMVIVQLPEFAHCAVVFYQGKRIADLEVEKPLPIVPDAMTLEFHFSSTNPASTKELPRNFFQGSNNPLTPEIVQTFGKHGITQALISNLQMPSVLTTYNETGNIETLLYLMIHEGFHLTQMGYYANPDSPWPHWDRYPLRGNELIKNCYKRKSFTTPLVPPTDLDALFLALERLFVKKNPDSAIVAAKDFIRLRNERYVENQLVKLATAQQTDSISCAQAESIMEMEEGVAEYLGRGSLFALGLLSPQDLLRKMKNPSRGGQWFYSGGFAQLLLLRELQGKDEFAKTTSRIAKSDSWEKGIFYEFTKYIQTK